jgi:uncharacterized protein
VGSVAARLFFIVALAAGSTSLAAGARIPPVPTRFVTDNANFLSPAARLELEQKLEGYQHQTGHQVLVWIGRTDGDSPIEDFAAEAFKSWGVGRRGLDDGLVLFVLPDARLIRIEVGYGLENVLPDVRAAQVIRDVITPRLRAGDRDGAITAGVDQLLSLIGGGVARAAPAPLAYRQRPAPRQASPLEIAFCALVGLAFVIFLITHPTMALFMLSTVFSGGRRGRYDGFGGGGGGGDFGGGGGGGFSGGGGSSGGGGATGSW